MLTGALASDRVKAKSWAEAQGLKSGDPFASQDSERIRKVHDRWEIPWVLASLTATELRNGRSVAASIASFAPG